MPNPQSPTWEKHMDPERSRTQLDSLIGKPPSFLPEYDPTLHPTVDVMMHIIDKGIQTGCCISAGLVAPATLLYKRTMEGSVLYKPMAYSAMGIAGLVIAGGAARVASLDREGLEDRAYRLHHNIYQKRIDGFMSFGMAGGLATGVFMSIRQGIPLVAFTAAGCALSMLAYQLTKSQHDIHAEYDTPRGVLLSKKINQEIEDKWRTDEEKRQGYTR